MPRWRRYRSQRRGAPQSAGRIRHIHTKTLWLQRHVTEKRVKLSKTLGTLNVADIGTKRRAAADRDKLLKMMGYRVATGRSDIAVGIAGDFELEPAHAGTAADAAEGEDDVSHGSRLGGRVYDE